MSQELANKVAEELGVDSVIIIAGNSDGVRNDVFFFFLNVAPEHKLMSFGYRAIGALLEALSSRMR